MPEKISLVADFDDTVVERASGLIRDVIHQTLVDNKIDLPSNEERRRIDLSWGSPIDVMYGQLFKEEAEILAECKALGAEKLSAIKQTHLAYMRTMYAKHVRLVPGSLDVLHRLKNDRGYSIGITTATPREVITDEVFPNLGIPKELIDPVISAEDLQYSSWAKPDPYTVYEILRLHGSRPENSVMVGDSKADVLAAKAAGIGKIVVVRTGLLQEQANQGELSFEDIIEGLGVVVIDDFSQLEAVL